MAEQTKGNGKKIEGWANPNDSPDVVLWHEEQMPKGLTLPATLVIGEKAFTESEVKAMLLRVDRASNFPFSAAIVKAFRAEGFEVEND